MGINVIGPKRNNFSNAKPMNMIGQNRHKDKDEYDWPRASSVQFFILQMPNQSGPEGTFIINSNLLDVKSKILNDKAPKLMNCDYETLKISTRNQVICQELIQTPGFLEKLVKGVFSDEIDSEGIKAIINIARNDSSAQLPLATLSNELLNDLCLKHDAISGENKFLISRLLFLLTIGAEGAKIILSQSEGVEKFIEATFSQINPEKSDDSEEVGKICIELLRYRYNLIQHELIDHLVVVKESAKILKVSLSNRNVNLVGSYLNVCLGKRSERIEIQVEIETFEEILDIFICFYLSNENRDYLGTAMLIALKLVDSNRSIMRGRFLPSPSKESNYDLIIGNWKKLLLVPDTSISFLTGEFLLKLCSGDKRRFLRHVGFESSAGFLYSKGILQSEEETGGNDSSDEEYFQSHPIETTDQHTPSKPETQEESDELEYLMNKITEYNSKSQRY